MSRGVEVWKRCVYRDYFGNVFTRERIRDEARPLLSAVAAIALAALEYNTITSKQEKGGLLFMPL